MAQIKAFMDRSIPDEGPLGAAILVIGEAPGEQEYLQHRLFVGPSGDKLIECLGRYGVSRGEIRLANVCSYRPYGNEFTNLVGSSVYDDGVRRLHQYIRQYRPVVILTCGNWPFAITTGKAKWKKDSGSSVKVPSGVRNWRGSVLPYVDENGVEHEDIKVIPTFHPSIILRERKLYPIFDFDIRRMVEQSKARGISRPKREFILNPKGMDLEYYTQMLEREHILGVDIETVKESSHILCVGFAPRPDFAVCITPDDSNGVRAISRILASKSKKVFQFGTFDTTQLNINGYSIARDNASELSGRLYYWDTLIAQHVMEPEFPRDLGFLTSIYTNEPYYKTEGRADIPGDQKGWNSRINRDNLYIYNCKDCCVTIEIALQQMEELSTLSRGLNDTFNFEMQSLNVVRHISYSGMLIDAQRMELFKNTLIAKWAKLQFLIQMVTGVNINVRSPALKDVLYGKESPALGLPMRKNRDGRPTTDDAALVSLIGYITNHISGLKTDDARNKWRIKLAVIKAIREIREVRQRLSNYVLAPVSTDGRSRAVYKVGATETGRWSANSFVDGTGYNHQTNPRDPIEVSDEDYEKYKEYAALLEQLSEEDKLSEMEELVA